MNAAKLGKCVKFELLDMAKGIAVFFGVMALVYAGNLIWTIGIFGGKAEDGFLSSVEFASVIFLFVSGIVMFGQYFRLFLQCGMGRGLLSGMSGVEDSLGGIESWYYIEVLRGGRVQTPDQARDALRAVTKEEVRSILRRLSLSVSYLLTKEDDHVGE